MSERTADTLADALPREMSRVRDEVLPAYREVLKYAPMTQLVIDMMRQSLDVAQKALAEGDVVAMLRCYEDLKEYKL